jgi:hypothetical protein
MSFTENLYLKRMIQQLQEENLKLKKILSEQVQMVGDVTGNVKPPKGYTGSVAKSLFKVGDQHYVVSHGGTEDPDILTERGFPKETAIFPSDERGNYDARKSLMTLPGHHDHESAARQFAGGMGGADGGELDLGDDGEDLDLGPPKTYPSNPRKRSMSPDFKPDHKIPHKGPLSPDFKPKHSF